MMLRWISSVPPAIDVAGTETRISAITPFIGLSEPESSESAPESWVCTRAAARAAIDGSITTATGSSTTVSAVAACAARI